MKTIGLARAALAGDGEKAGGGPAASMPTAPAPAGAEDPTKRNGAAVPGGAAIGGAPGSGTATSGKPAAGAAAGEAPVTDAERTLLLDLRHRRTELEARGRDLDQRDAIMAAAEQKLSARVVQLTALQARLETLEAARQQHDSANWTGLVHVYETMKPRDAALIFDALDMQVLLGVLDRMAERKAAPILAAMQPDRARLATQLLVEMRTRAVTPAGDPPAPAAVGPPAATTAAPKG